MNYLLVAVGGALGALSRYQISSWWATYLQAPGWGGTLCVNAVGGFLIGLFMALSHQYGVGWGGWSLLLITGFCGGFTTFSTFSYELFRLLTEGSYLTALLYVTLSVLLALLAVIGGYTLATHFVNN